MKNMFGIVPDSRYGWPKSILHLKDIQEGILDICATGPISFVIADGIVAMEGNGAHPTVPNVASAGLCFRMTPLLLTHPARA
jgi:uncharacterized protein (DUF362 family)